MWNEGEWAASDLVANEFGHCCRMDLGVWCKMSPVRATIFAANMKDQASIHISFRTIPLVVNLKVVVKSAAVRWALK